MYATIKSISHRFAHIAICYQSRPPRPTQKMQTSNRIVHKPRRSRKLVDENVFSARWAGSAARNEAAGTGPTNPVTIPTGVTDERETKSEITCAAGVTSDETIDLTIVEDPETAQR